MKDYLYRRKVKYQCRPAYIAVDVLVALAIIFSGPLLSAVSVGGCFCRIVALSRSQVQYYLPRGLKEIERQSYWDVTMICVEMAICMILWFVPSLMLYNKLSGVVRQYPIFMILWIIVTIMSLFRVGLDSMQAIWSGKNENEITIGANSQKEILGYITGFFTNGFNIFFGASIIEATMSDVNPWMYQSTITICLLIVTMILIIIDVYRCIKRWTIADFSE